MVSEVSTKIKLRQDTSANWATSNPILALGEPAMSTTTNQMKIGDGTTTWNNLPWLVPDVSKYLITEDAGSAVSPVPINADKLSNHVVTDFTLVTDIVDNLTTSVANKPLSASQGMILKGHIPTKLSQLTNDSSYTTTTDIAPLAPKSSPTFTGTPKTSANTSYTTAQLRNVILTTTVPTSAIGSNGDIVLVYEA